MKKHKAAKEAVSKIKKMNLPPLEGVGKPKGKAMPVEDAMMEMMPMHEKMMSGSKRQKGKLPKKDEVWY